MPPIPTATINWPGLGTLVTEAQALWTRLSAERASSAPGASSLTAAELRVLPILATHLSFREIGAEMFLSPHTVKSQVMSISGSWAPHRATRPSCDPVSSGSWRGDIRFHPIGRMPPAPARGGLVA